MINIERSLRSLKSIYMKRLRFNSGFFNRAPMPAHSQGEASWLVRMEAMHHVCRTLPIEIRRVLFWEGRDKVWLWTPTISAANTDLDYEQTHAHRCADHIIAPETETLIVGTFNPDTKPNPADFFYGRPHNNLWAILPDVFGEESLKGKTKEEKLRFIRDKRIDFIDLIWALEGEPPDYSDAYLDKMPGIRWREDIIRQIEKLRSLKRVCVSRKGFAGVPNIKEKVDEIVAYLLGKPIAFKCVHTPARGYFRAKVEWAEFLRGQPATTV